MIDHALNESGKCRVACLLCVILVIGLPVHALEMDQPSLIHDAYADGRLDREGHYRCLMQSILDPENLPVEFATDVPHKCGTHVLLEIESNLGTLSTEMQELFATLDVRPEAECEYVSPDSFFKLHYDTASGQATPPVPIEDLDSSGIPDFIENMALYADSAWRQIVQNFGHHRPPSDGTLGGDSLYDIYFKQFQYYGITNGDNEGPEPWDDYSSHIVLHNSFDIFPPNQDPEGNQKGSMKVAIAHELYHAVQFYYDAFIDTWWMEQTAVWMEDEVYPGIHDNYNYFDDFWPSPEMSLFEEDIIRHMYGSFVWPKYLTEVHGDLLIKGILEGMATPTSSLMNVIVDVFDLYGTTFDDEFRRFLFWNYMTGSRDDGHHYVDAADYPEIAIEHSYDSLPALQISSFSAPYNRGSNYIEVYNDSSYIGILAFGIDTAYSAPWSLSYITVDTAGVYDFLFRNLSGGGEGKTYVGPFQEYDKVVFIPHAKGLSMNGPYGFVYSVYFRPIGDADASENIDIDDVIWIINYIFSGGPPSEPYVAMDADCSGNVDIDDVVYLISYIFSAGPQPCGEGF